MDLQTFAHVEQDMPDLFSAMRKNLQEHPNGREFEISAGPGMYQMERYAFEYYECDHPELRGKIRILLNHGLILDLSQGRTMRYAMMEPLVAYLKAPPVMPGNQATPSKPEICSFHKSGGVWTLAFEGKTAYVPDAVGLGYICELLRRPNVAIEAAQLTGESADSSNLTALPGLPLTDDKTISAVRGALADRKRELASLQKGDWPRTGKLKEQIEQLEKYLGQVTGHRGQPRVVAGTAEQSRTKVTNAVKRAIESISKVHPGLGSHLKKATKTGTALIYAPENLPEWVF
jgi:hypothetical protein